MRLLAAIAVVAICVMASVALGDGVHPDARATPKQEQSRPKPPDATGNDVCRYARDNVCDEPGIGGGACAPLTDRSDCAIVRAGADNDSCRFAHNRQCDEPTFGAGQCVQGSDRSDCGDLTNIRNRDDSCATAFNSVCEEPGVGSGACEARTDRADCAGRRRPMTINDHFFGNDDRMHVAADEAPWRFMGQLRMDAGAACSATLIAPDVIATAAHCIAGEDGVDARGSFVSASGDHRAQVTAYLIDPAYTSRRFRIAGDIDGLDWALLRLDQRLGDALGFANPRRVSGPRLPTNMMQAGYAWDTGATLTGHIGCPMLEVRIDNTFAHACDTTRGDSGSGFIVRNGGGFDLVGIDSAFHPNLAGPDSYVAVSAGAFAALAPDFIAGRSGEPVGRVRPLKNAR
jgi:protease YdgD